MTDPRSGTEPDHQASTEAAGPGGGPPGLPRWVKLSVAAVALLAVVVVAILLLAGGDHGPDRHGGGGGHAADVLDPRAGDA